MEYKSLFYKGNEIKPVQEESEEYFLGCYVNTIRFSDQDTAKAFIDRMTAVQETDSR
jgi:hypothetical protein